MRKQLPPPPPKPREGQTRVRSWFAWRPVTIGYEQRWLEKVTVLEVCRYHSLPHIGKVPEWDKVKFIDE